MLKLSIFLYILLDDLDYNQFVPNPCSHFLYLMNCQSSLVCKWIELQLQPTDWDAESYQIKQTYVLFVSIVFATNFSQVDYTLVEITVCLMYITILCCIVSIHFTCFVVIF